MPEPDPSSTARGDSVTDLQHQEVLTLAAETAAGLVAGRVVAHQIDGNRRGWVVLEEVGGIDERRQIYGGEVSDTVRTETQYENVLLTIDGELLIETCFEKVFTRGGTTTFRELRPHDLARGTPHAIREFDFPRADRGWRTERRGTTVVRTWDNPRTYKRGPAYPRAGGAVIEALRRLPADPYRPTRLEIVRDWSAREAARLTTSPPQPPPPLPSPWPSPNLTVVLLLCGLLMTTACCVVVCLVATAVR